MDTGGRNERIIREYIRKQLEDDYMQDQAPRTEYMGLFAGSKNKNVKKSGRISCGLK